jgi:hypothetical protein
MQDKRNRYVYASILNISMEISHRRRGSVPRAYCESICYLERTKTPWRWVSPSVIMYLVGKMYTIYSFSHRFSPLIRWWIHYCLQHTWTCSESLAHVRSILFHAPVSKLVCRSAKIITKSKCLCSALNSLLKSQSNPNLNNNNGISDTYTHTYIYLYIYMLTNRYVRLRLQ